MTIAGAQESKGIPYVVPITESHEPSRSGESVHDLVQVKDEEGHTEEIG